MLEMRIDNSLVKTGEEIQPFVNLLGSENRESRSVSRTVGKDRK